MRTPRIAAASLLAATALAGIAAGETDDPAAVDVSAVTAGVNGGTLSVGGTLDFGGRFEAGVDLSDPNQQGKLPGTNFTAASVTQEGPFLEFTIDIANMVPADPYSAPETLQYGWDIVDGNGEPVSLSAFRTAVAQTGSTDGYFVINTCSPDPDTGQSTCSGSPSDGEFTADGVTWRTLAGTVGAPGRTLSLFGDAPAHVTPGVGGLIWFSGGGALDLDNLSTFGDFAIGGRVDVSVTSATGNVVAATSKSLMTPGDFATTLDVSGLPAGTYTVTVSSDYADLSDSETTTFTIG